MPEPSDPEELVRATRLAEAAAARSRRADWAQLGAEEATVASCLERLAVDGRGVRLTRWGGSHQGSVAEVGPDHVRIAGPGRWAYLRLSAVQSVEAAGTHVGTRPVRVNRTFVEELSRRVGAVLTLVLADGTTPVGTVVAVGAEVVTVGREAPAGPLYVASSAVVAALGDGSG